MFQGLFHVQQEGLHEAVVQGLTGLLVDLGHGFGFDVRLSPVGQQIADAEEVRFLGVGVRFTVQPLFEALQRLAELLLPLHGKAVAQALHLGDHGGKGAVVRGDQPVVPDHPVRPDNAAAGFADALFVLFEQGDFRLLDAVQHPDGLLLGVFPGVFQLDGGHGKAVELLALALGVRHAGGGHVLFQLLEHVVKALFAVRPALLVVEDHRLGQLFADAHDGVQGGKRVLEDHGQLVPAQGVEILLGDLQKIPAVVDDFAVLHHGVARQNAHDRAGGDGLAGAGFAGDGQGLALVQVKGDVTHCPDCAIGRAEGNGQMPDL